MQLITIIRASETLYSNLLSRTVYHTIYVHTAFALCSHSAYASYSPIQQLEQKCSFLYGLLSVNVKGLSVRTDLAHVSIVHYWGKTRSSEDIPKD